MVVLHRDDSFGATIISPEVLLREILSDRGVWIEEGMQRKRLLRQENPSSRQSFLRAHDAHKILKYFRDQGATDARRLLEALLLNVTFLDMESK